MATPIRLTKQQQQQIDAALRQLHDALPAIDAMERCGEDCQQQRQEAKLLLDRLTAYKREFTQQ